MNETTASREMSPCRGLLLLLVCFLLAGCGGGDLRPEGAGVEEHMHGAEIALLSGMDLRNVPIVFVDRQKGSSRFVYRLQGQDYLQADLLGLCRALADNDPDAMVCIVPSGALTRDEVGLLEAKLRETGIRNIRNLGFQGSRK